MDHSIWKAASVDDKALAAIPRIRRLTDGNHTSDAYAMGSAAIGARKLVKQFELIGQLIALEGHRSHHLGEYQYSLYEEMLKYAKQQLSPEVYEEFYGSF